MPQVFTKAKLSGSTNGKPVKIAATATAGTTVHTAVSGTAAYDEIYLYLTNTSTSAVTVTIEYGAVTDPDGLICKAMSLPPSSGPILVIPGLLLNNSLVLAVFASSANVVLATGFVNQIV